MSTREHRRWTKEGDSILRRLVEGGPDPTNWHNVAAHLPGRSHQECRRRWRQTLEANFNTGTWSPAEDESLRTAVAKHGPRWTLVAEEVGTRNGDQCFKRWNDALRPGIDHGPWLPEEDQVLLQKVEEHGRNWKIIAESSFPNRAPLSLKNRYCLLLRRHGDSARTSRSSSVRRESKSNSDVSSTTTPSVNGEDPTSAMLDYFAFSSGDGLDIDLDLFGEGDPFAMQLDEPWSPHHIDQNVPAVQIASAVADQGSNDKVLVTAHCARDRLGNLIEAMIGIVDSVAIGKVHPADDNSSTMVWPG